GRTLAAYLPLLQALYLSGPESVFSQCRWKATQEVGTFVIDAQEDSPINSALRHFEATEANLAKLERLWSKIRKLIPDGLQFGRDRAYEEYVRIYEDVLG